MSGEQHRRPSPFPAHRCPPTNSIRSIGRHVDAGHIPAVTPAQEEAMRVLEETAHKIALHMILDVGDVSGAGEGD